MKKQTKVQRLSLSRETLRQLDLEKNGQLPQVAGGTGSLCEDTCITSHNPLCPTRP
ncbi:MAG TPA: hypothetical protein VFE33_13130 [Thermoanaerobaculia bacterium]|nr:hypothetical protein [Thermoanaerobaculia bacterium]